MLQTFTEKRQELRRDVARIAKIQVAPDAVPFYCIVTDTSDGGVRLQASGFDVPDEFALLPCGGALQCGTFRVVWRHRGEVGAKLMKAG